MKNLILSLLMSASLVGPACCQAPTNPRQPETETAKSSPFSGVILSASTARKVSAGTPFPVVIELTNDGNMDAIVGIQRQDFLAVKVDLTDDEGRAVPFTRFAKRFVAPTDPLDILARGNMSFRLVTLRPDKSVKLSIANLALFYDLTAPGDYVLKISRGVIFRDPKKTEAELKTGPIRFSVTLP